MSDKMFFNSNGDPLSIEGSFKNRACFLIVGGPSLSTFDLDKLKQPGVITFGVNNSVKVFRPNMWTMVDDVKNFMISIWKDPTIMKFVPFPKRRHKLFDNTTWRDTDIRVRECPNVVYFNRNNKFDHEKYLYEKEINWGSSKENGGCRSVFLSVVRIIHILGFRTVFTIGADFKMDYEKQNYAWDQERSKSSVRNNNNTYRTLNKRFDLLRPIFEKEQFYMFNSTPDSGFKSFPYIPFDEAIKIALRDFPDVDKEPLSGMYDRKSKVKEYKELGIG